MRCSDGPRLPARNSVCNPPDPSPEVESDIGVDVGNYGRRYLTAGVSGPVTDDFVLRFNAMSWNEDGYYDEGFTGSSLGGGDGYGLGLTGKWDATETFSVRGRVAYSNDDFDQQATLFDPVNTLLDPPQSAIDAGIINAVYARRAVCRSIT